MGNEIKIKWKKIFFLTKLKQSCQQNNFLVEGENMNRSINCSAALN